MANTQYQSNVDFHYLDLGIARFMEFGAILVIPGSLNPDHLKSGAFELLRVWPILKRRLDLLGGRLIEHQDNDPANHLIFWQSKTYTHSLSDLTPCTSSEPGKYKPSLDLQSILAFPDATKDLLKPPVFYIRAAFLKDGCLLGFYIQHPLCDYHGLHRIINAYTLLLAGEPIDPVPPRSHVLLKTDQPPVQTSDNLASSMLSPTRIAKLQLQTVLIGWWPLIRRGVRQAFCVPRQVEQVERSCLISFSVINDLRLQAIKDGHNVTLNDLIMAHLWKASTACRSWRKHRLSEKYPSFSFVLSIRRQIENDTVLHNPWVTIQVPNPPTTEFGAQNITSLAVHLHSTVRNARATECLLPIINLHENASRKPMMLESDFLVTSWSQLSLYDTEFPSGENIKVGPQYIQPFVRMPSLFRKFGMRINNVVVTSQDRSGDIWIHGNLEEAVWRKLEDMTRMK